MQPIIDDGTVKPATRAAGHKLASSESLQLLNPSQIRSIQ